MSFPKYPAYKPSGIEWLGEVPAHWELCALKRITDLKSGESITAEDIDEYGTYPVFGGNGFRGYTEKFTHNGTFALIGRQGALCGNINYATGKFYASEHAIVSKPKVTHETYWIGKLLRAMNLNQYSVSAAQPGLSVEIVGNLRIPFPPLSEQSAIAAFLTRETAKIDALVAEQQKLIALLKEKRQAVISHAVTKGLDPSVPMKDSGVEWLGEVPKHWEVKALKFIATVQTGIAKGKDNTGKDIITVPYLRVANVQDGYLALDDMAEIEIPVADLQRYLLQSGDVLMNEGGDFDKLGRGHVWDGSISPCIHQNHVFAVRPHAVSPEWLNTITGSSYAQFYFMTRSKQSTNLASISSTSIMELPVVLPPPKEQATLLEFLMKQTTSFDTLTAEAQSAIALLQERRTALISAAVTGKMDVRGITA
ncbi:restriction endonuclease subunit S [Leptothrix ochracea]|uniref:restriction endonuclease subunit S n=1 Tax=Leptothrix ochracea TaxID=735331 RepID=UPI0034E242EE